MLSPGQDLPTLLPEDLARQWPTLGQGGVLLDIREPWETAVAPLRPENMPVRHIPMGELPQHLEALLQLPFVVCFCHHGVRSAQVVAWLARHGHTSVYNLAGGTDRWSLRVDPGVPRY